jgi:molybdopterin-guanine dinucleotide biosynthesis protein A
MNLSAVILAGGKSARMGRDKARLEIGGRPLLARQLQLIRETGAGEVFVSGRAGEDYTEFKCPVLYDRFQDAGPLAGIERALATASSSRVLVVAVDVPNLTPVILKQLIGRGRETMGVIPRIEGRMEPLAAIYSKSAWNPAIAQLDDGIYAVKTFAERCVQDGLAEFFDFDASAAHYFANWNLPSDALAGIV